MSVKRDNKGVKGEGDRAQRKNLNFHSPGQTPLGRAQWPMKQDANPPGRTDLDFSPQCGKFTYEGLFMGMEQWRGSNGHLYLVLHKGENLIEGRE